MKCPKCGFNQADINDTCKKCGRDLSGFKAKLGASSPSSGARLKSFPKLKENVVAKAERDRLDFERSRLAIEKAKMEKAQAKALDSNKIEQERRRIEAQRKILQSQRMVIEAKQKSEKRALDGIRQEQEHKKLELEKKMLELDKARFEAEKEGERQKQFEQERLRKKERLKAERYALEQKLKNEKRETARIRAEQFRLEQERSELEKQQSLRASLQENVDQEKFSIKSYSPQKKADFPVEDIPEPILQEEDPLILDAPVDLIVVDKGGLILRSIAGSVDLFLIGIALLFFLLVAKAVFSWGMPQPESMGLSAFLLLTMPIYILTVIIASGYFTYFHASFGQTPGKKLLGLKLVDLDGRPPGYATSFLRFVAGAFSFGLCFMGFIWIGLDLNKQGWHDKIAQTVVIKQNG
jgi:uncharacterized RDD family membrane protein YckC